MGSRGPIPKRSDVRRRTNEPEGGIDSAPGADEVLIPAPHEGWHPIASEWYASLAESGQSDFYEPSDWAFAYYVAELLTRSLGYALDGAFVPVKVNGQLVTAVMAGMTELLTTEGARRRARIELERGAAPPDPQAEHAATVTQLRSIAGNG